MMTTQQPRAIKLASEYRETMPADVLHLWSGEVVDELRRLHEEAVDLRVLTSSLLNKTGGLKLAFLTVQDANTALQARVQELEAQLEAIGAGGVEPLRKADHFRGATEMVPDQFRDATKMMTQEPEGK